MTAVYTLSILLLCGTARQNGVIPALAKQNMKKIYKEKKMKRESKETPGWFLAFAILFIIVFFILYFWGSNEEKQQAESGKEVPTPKVYEFKAEGADSDYYYVVWVAENGEKEVFICRDSGTGRFKTSTMAKATHHDGTGYTPEELGLEIPEE